MTLKAPGADNKVRPKKVYSSYASYCSLWGEHLEHWHHWGADSTNSAGLVHYSTGRPDCARGSRLVHGRVGLSHIHRCGDRLHYGREHFVYFHHHHYDARVVLSCRGNPVKYIPG